MGCPESGDVYRESDEPIHQLMEWMEWGTQKSRSPCFLDTSSSPVFLLIFFYPAGRSQAGREEMRPSEICIQGIVNNDDNP